MSSNVKNVRRAPHTPAKKFTINKATVLLIAAALVVLVGIGVALSSAASNVTYVPQVRGRANAEISRTVIDHGDVRMEETVESVFRIRNTGDQPLLINGEPRVELVQGCCPPRAIIGILALNPGEETTILLRYTMHDMMAGPHEFRVHVLTNDPIQSEILLTSLSNWIE